LPCSKEDSRIFLAVVRLMKSRGTKIASALLLLASTAGCGPGPDTSSSREPVADSARQEVPDDAMSASPSLEGTPPEVRLVLPARFEEVLAAEGSFSTLGPADFGPEILRGTGGFTYPWSGTEAPFAVIADFDGDGRRDVAVLQRSATHGRAAVVLNTEPRPRLTELRRWARADAGDTGALSPFYVRLHPAGTMRVPDFGGTGADTTVTLAHEGIEVVAYGQAARTYWYSNGAFTSLTTAD
jgi:hypothetical protein